MINKLTALLIFFALLGCEEKEDKNEQEALEIATNKAPSTLVNIDTAEVKPFYLLIESAGKVTSAKDVVVLSQFQGIIEKANIKEGLYVKKGGTLIVFNQTEALLKYKKAKLDFEKNELEFKNNLIGYPKLLALEEPSKDSLYINLKKGSGLEESGLLLQEAEYALAKTRIKAPFSGFIYDIQVFSGKSVNIGDELFALYNNEIYVEVNLLESEAVNLSKGDPVLINNSNIQKNFTGNVASINPKVDENGLVKVKILTKDSKDLWPGMNVSVEIKIPKGVRLQVPKESLVLRSGKAVVFTLENELAKWNYVTAGLDNGKEVEIIEGIEAGKTVITNNNLQLAHDAPVSIANKAE